MEKHKKIGELRSFSSFITKDMRELILSCIDKDTNKRPMISQLLSILIQKEKEKEKSKLIKSISK